MIGDIIMENKKTAIRYFTKSGNTKRLADAIAKAIGTEAKPIPAASAEYIDILFLGASVYWGGIAAEVKEYIKALDSGKVGKVAVFSTSAFTQRAFPQIKKLLANKGITLEEDNFYCRGQFKAFYAGAPTQKDIDNAERFALKIKEKR